MLKKLLQDISFVKTAEETTVVNQLKEPETQYESIKKILDQAKRKDLFKAIKDPVEWLRELRREWDRDFEYND